MSGIEQLASMVDRDWFTRPDGTDASATIHGIGHTVRVLAHAIEIAEAVGAPEWEREAVTLAALWHDIGRTNDGADYYHGAKSAGKVVGLGLQVGLEDRVREAALFAVTHHSGSERHAQQDGARHREGESILRVFRILKDADALDRVRLGDLDTSYLRFHASLERVDVAWELLEAMSCAW